MAQTLGKRLKVAREKRGLSTRELDAAAGLTPGHSWQIETGARKSPAMSTMVALAKALGVTVDSLVSSSKIKEA